MGKQRLRKTKASENCQSNEDEEMATGESSETFNVAEANAHTDALQASIYAIHADIKAGQKDLKKDLNELCETIRRDMKEEIRHFKEDVDQKLSEIGDGLKNTEVRMDDVEKRVAEIEEWNTGAKDVLLQTLQEQERIQSKLLDLETRSRRNNLRIFGIPEGEEGPNPGEFMEKFIKTELSLPNIDLNIQRCHRSLGPKPPPPAPPRSMIVCFLVHTIKEQVLNTAWKKKGIQFNGTKIYFDHDYPVEIIKQRKEYAPLRKVLKEKGLRFHTPPPAKLRVFYDEGPATYNTAQDARDDLLKRGILTAGEAAETPVIASQTDAAATPRRTLRKNTWETRGAGKRWNRAADLERAREKLRRFQHSLSHTENDA